MTNEELLNNEIYCPNKVDLSIVVYLKLGFRVLLSYNEEPFIATKPGYILLKYAPEFFSTLDFRSLICLKSICNVNNITSIASFGIAMWIDRDLTFTIYVGSNQIEDLKLYLTNYGNKN